LTAADEYDEGGDENESRAFEPLAEGMLFELEV
jgi:hypothetical protein